MRSKKIHFIGSHQTRLSGQIDFPDDGNIKAFAIYAHCFSCGSQLKLTHHIAKALTMDNIALLRFNFTGLGESAGEFSNTNLSTNIDDIHCAADFLSKNYQPPKILIGHSMGGSAGLIAAPHIQSCRAVALLGTPANPAFLADIYAPQMEQLKQNGEFPVSIGGKTFILKEHFFDDLIQHRSKKNIAKLNKALLIIHALQDELVGIEHAEWLFETAQQPKSLIVMDNADHLFSKNDDAFRIGQIISNWASFYVETI